MHTFPSLRALFRALVLFLVVFALVYGLLSKSQLQSTTDFLGDVENTPVTVTALDQVNLKHTTEDGRGAEFSVAIPKEERSWLSGQLFEIENNLGRILSKHELTDEDKAEVGLVLEMVFKDQSIARNEKIRLARNLWLYAEQSIENLFLLQHSIKNYKPKELTELMLPVLSSTVNEKLYVSTLDLLRESYSSYYATGQYDNGSGDGASDYQPEDILPLVETIRFDSDATEEVRLRAQLQFSPLNKAQEHWRSILLSDLSQNNSVDAVDDFVLMLLGRKGEQDEILKVQLQHIENMNDPTRKRFLERLWQIKKYESEALSTNANNFLSQFLGGDA